MMVQRTRRTAQKAHCGMHLQVQLTSDSNAPVPRQCMKTHCTTLCMPTSTQHLTRARNEVVIVSQESCILQCQRMQWRGTYFSVHEQGVRLPWSALAPTRLVDKFALHIESASSKIHEPCLKQWQ